MMEEVKVTFEPSGRSVHVLPGTILLEAAARAGFVIETPCGGMGSCGKCIVRVTDGDCPAGDDSAHALGKERCRDGYRLACRCRIQSPLTVEIPESSLFRTGHKILESSAVLPLHLNAGVRNVHVSIPADAEAGWLDAGQLRAATGAERVDADALRPVASGVGDPGSGVTATLSGDRVLRVVAGDGDGPLYGVAFDIGTTTVVATLVDLETGRHAAVASMINPQTSYGDDVIARIRKCREEDTGLEVLRAAIISAANKLIAEACGKAGTARDTVVKVALSGNTTMQQIFCGMNPRALGEIPFEPAFYDMLFLEARALGLEVCPGATVIVFPQIGGFVGGDTVAGILATEMDRCDKPVLLVDVGTNGEIVLAHDGKLRATSVAAGPAFEGARIIHGMRATSGAIEKVVLNDDVEINVIGNARPSGICGTGLIDGVAALLRTGILDETGRILGPDEQPADLKPNLASRVIPNGSQYDFVLARADETAGGTPVCLHQRDIRELQLANGAIRAGISILLQMADLTPDDLHEILLAGAFGNFIRRSNAARIGMLPAISHDRIRFVGNTASFGALRALLSTDEAERAQGIRDRTEHVDLSLRADFQMEFSMAMMFPEG